MTDGPFNDGRLRHTVGQATSPQPSAFPRRIVQHLDDLPGARIADWMIDQRTARAARELQRDEHLATLAAKVNRLEQTIELLTQVTIEQRRDAQRREDDQRASASRQIRVTLLLGVIAVMATLGTMFTLKEAWQWWTTIVVGIGFGLVLYLMSHSASRLPRRDLHDPGRRTDADG